MICLIIYLSSILGEELPTIILRTEEELEINPPKKLRHPHQNNTMSMIFNIDGTMTSNGLHIAPLDTSSIPPGMKVTTSGKIFGNLFGRTHVTCETDSQRMILFGVYINGLLVEERIDVSRDNDNDPERTPSGLRKKADGMHFGDTLIIPCLPEDTVVIGHIVILQESSFSSKMTGRLIL